MAAHPRTGFKTGIVEAFSAGMRDKPETTFGTMNTDILEATVPTYVRPNFCDYIRKSPFETWPGSATRQRPWALPGRSDGRRAGRGTPRPRSVAQAGHRRAPAG